MEIDISTAGGALIITVLRLAHIVAGLIWVGAAIVMSCYIEPALDGAGADGKPVLRRLYSESNLTRLIPLSALITTVAGLLLYGLMAYHEAMSSSMGLVLTLGALVGLLAFGMASSRSGARPVASPQWPQMTARTKRR